MALPRMRARLLDMGDVHAVRSESIHRAIASLLGPESDPVLVVVRAAGPIVSISEAVTATTEVDLDVCRHERIPVVRRPGDGCAWVVDPGHLLLQLVIPMVCRASLGIRSELERWPPELAEPLVGLCRGFGIAAALAESGRVEVDGRCIGRFETTATAAALGVVWDVFLNIDPELEAKLLSKPPGVSVSDFATSLAATSTGLAAELTETVVLAEIAEALVAAVEAKLGLELVPSMPTPDEMAAIYEWDERLPIAELFDEVGPGAASLTAYLM